MIVIVIIHYVLKKKEICSDMLSKYCSDNADQYGIKVGVVKKLVSNLKDKIKYVVNYKNLEYYLSVGMKLVKIHKILSFKQSNCLKSYVDFVKKENKEVVNLIRIS